MKKIGTVFLTTLLLLTVTLSLTAQGQVAEEPSEPRSRFEGMEMNVLYMAVGGHQDTGKLVGEFEDKYGVKVNFEMVPEPNYDAKMDMELIPDEGVYDAVWLLWRSYHRWVEAGLFEPLDGYINDPDLVEPDQLDLDGFFPNAVRSLRNTEGELMGLPAFSDGAIFVYREDLYEDAGIAGPPSTWEEVADYAAKLHTKDVAGYAMRTSRGGGAIGWMVPMILRAYGGGVIKDYPNDWSGNLLSEGSIAGSEWYVDTLKKYTFPGGLTAHWMETVTAFQQGKLAQLSEAWVMMGQLLDPEMSKPYDSIGFAPVPAGPADRIASGAVHGVAIPANAPQKELGYKFIEWVLSESTQRRNVVENGSATITRPAIMDDPSYVNNFEYSGDKLVGAVQESLEYYIDAMFRPMSAVWREVEEQLGIGYSELLTGNKQLRPTLEQMNKNITNIHKTAGFPVR
jgi:ABC-type glycerol-3-phosphate transport system substrate-binding protein